MKAKKDLWILLLVFIAPIGLSLLLYWASPGFLKKTTNYGKLIEPQIVLDASDLIFKDARAKAPRIWQMLLWVESCDTACYQALENMTTIQILTKNNAKRLQNTLLTADANTPKSSKSNFTKAELSDLDATQVKFSQLAQDTIYLIDPEGNFVLSYNPSNLDLKKVVKDLKRLFRYSRIG